MDMTITQRLKILRAASAQSQWDVARLSGISNFRYHKIEGGYIHPSDAELDRIAAVFSLTREQLLDAPIVLPQHETRVQE